MELTNQGSFPLVFEVLLILHLIFTYFISFHFLPLARF